MTGWIFVAIIFFVFVQPLTIFVFLGSLHVQFILLTFPYKQFIGTGYWSLPILVIPFSLSQEKLFKACCFSGLHKRIPTS